MSKKSFSSLLNDHPILWSLGGIVVLIIVIILVTQIFLSKWTHHGQTTIVPDVIGMPLNQGVQTLEDNEFIVVTDSVFKKNSTPGSIVDVVPAQGSVVKKGREVYVTFVRFSPEYVVLDRNVSTYTLKTMQNFLKNNDIPYIEREVESEVDSNLVAVRYKGRIVDKGDKINVGEPVILEVGRRPRIVDVADSVGMLEPGFPDDEERTIMIDEL